MCAFVLLFIIVYLKCQSVTSDFVYEANFGKSTYNTADYTWITLCSDEDVIEFEGAIQACGAEKNYFTVSYHESETSEALMTCQVTPDSCSMKPTSYNLAIANVVDMCKVDSVNGNWDCVLPKDDYYKGDEKGKPSKRCLKVTCPSNYPGGSANCAVCGYISFLGTSYTGDTESYVKGYSAPSPPPPSPSPPPPPPPISSPPPTTTTTTSGDCECNCCKGNSCSASSVGFFNAGSLSSCSNDACRTQFPSSCPASGSSGQVASSYSVDDSSSTSYSSTPSSGIALTGLLGLTSAIIVTLVLA